MMDHSVLYIPSVFHSRRAKAGSRPVLELSKADFKWPLLFMLSMSLLGLNFYPAALFILAIMLNRLRNNRYDLLIMLFMLCGGYGLTHGKVLSVPLYDIGLIIGFGCAFVISKPPVVKKTLAVLILYFIGLLIIASYSWESMSVQLRVMRAYLSFIVFAVPLAVFANKPFEMPVFFRHMMVYALLMCAFYIIDAAVLKGDVFAPGNRNWDEITSVFYRPYMKPFSLSLYRKYPYGMYILALAIIPMARYYRLKWWMWALIAGGCLVTQTFSYIGAILTACILFQGSARRFFTLIGGAAVVFTGLYIVDSFLPRNKKQGEVSSALRIESSIDQFTDLFEAVDDEDLAEFASGRMAQVIPKVDLIEFYGKEATGLGFLHPELTKSSRLIIVNEYYTDVSKNEEVATAVEIVPVQVYIHSGWIGVFLHLFFFIAMWFIIRKCKYCSVFAAAVYTCFVCGLGGFASLASYQGLNIAATAFAVVILANRPMLGGFSDADVPRDDKNKEERSRTA